MKAILDNLFCKHQYLKIEFHAIPELILSLKSILDWHASRNNKGNFYFKRKSVVENKLKKRTAQKHSKVGDNSSGSDVRS